ncbi:uncharacterized protein DSM5745_09056 [Aspergillus mulundensis]|uniref:DUF7137 domain-containing protein n=1 Tax=Aspergillus mulundensis TaxID=1810919 RepID=A0A3D8QZU3_9EURO|nr:Uncharacterized protein DSM5745_09056 [Aspergillus mulundensis]RDW67190.1 Uncharacterized protein DSM5745_09056 [Aspergillus mulundensis]
MRFTSFFPIACLLLLAVLSTAWQLDGLNHGQLLPRQDDSSSDSDTTTAAESATTGATPTADDQAEETTTSTSSSDSNDEETTTATTTAKATHTGGSSSNSTTTRHSSNTTSIDARLPAGGTSMLTPNAYSTTYYKVMDTLTFVWNYTSLSITPTAVNVVAICTQNSATYTIASNISVEQTQTVTWDTGKVDANATAPLLTATYTLFVYDDTKEVGDTASAGELGSQNGYMFGMYTPQPYTPLNEYVCATCSDALSATDLLGLKMAVGMGLLTVASFTWFAGNFGAFST